MMRKLIWAVPLIALVLGLAVLSRVQAQGVQCGGAFLPNLNCLITGQWTWQRGTPFIFEGATADGFETSFVVTEPTRDNRITLQNTSGFLAMGFTLDESGIDAGTVTLDGTNPTSVTTTLGGITACPVVALSGAPPLTNAFVFRTQTTAGVSTLDIYAYSQSGAATTDSTTVVAYVCLGTLG